MPGSEYYDKEKRNMGPAKNDRMCARCDYHLATTNTNPDSLCGFCQKEISPHRGDKSTKYKEWVQGGKQRELHRTPTGRIKLLNGEPKLRRATTGLKDMSLEDLLVHRTQVAEMMSEVNAELKRRRAEFQAVLVALGEHLDQKE